MQRQPVTSSNLKEVGYDKDKQTLEVAFKNGTVFQYDGVPSELFEGLVAAPSPGSFFHSTIRSIYPAKRIE